MLGGFALALGDVGIAGSVNVNLHHEFELGIFLFHFAEADENFFPTGAAEEVVVHQEERGDAVIARGVTHPTDDRVGLARAHGAAHHVLHAAIRAGKGASARGVDRGHRGIEEAREIAVIEDGQLRIGNDRHDDVVLAGLGADAVGNRVVLLEFPSQHILDDDGPEVFGLTHDGGDAAGVEEIARLRIAADVEPAHHHAHALSDELERDIAATRILIGLHAGHPDEQFDAVFLGLFLDGLDGFGTDDPVADFVPDDGIEKDVAFGAEVTVVVFVKRLQHGQGVVRLDAIAEQLHVAFFIVARRLDEIDPDGAAGFRLQAILG